MKLVGAHYAADLVTPTLVIEARDARPEAGDLKNQLRAVGVQKLDIVRDLEVLPDIVGDGTADVALQVGVVGHPALRARVQVERLRFLLTVAAALPGKHRPLVSGSRGGRARLAQAPVAVHQQRSGDFGHAIVEEREDEQFIPEDMTLIGFSGPAPRGHTDDRVRWSWARRPAAGETCSTEAASARST